MSKGRSKSLAPGCPGGFTLLEALMAAAILGFATLGITTALTAGMKQNLLASQYTVAINLGQALLDESLSRPFYDPNLPANLTPGPETGEATRPQYDNIDDYHGYTESEGSLRGPDGALLNDSSLSGYSRAVTAAYVYLPGQDRQAPPTFILVTVEVQCRGVPLVRLQRLISSAERTAVP